MCTRYESCRILVGRDNPLDPGKLDIEEGYDS
jgi:hypothetical protein